jgi:hypothetical protein
MSCAMDDSVLASLAAEIVTAYPGDPLSQRRAWEFIEAITDNWPNSVDQTDGVDTVDNLSALVRSVGVRLASSVEAILLPAPTLSTLAQPPASPTFAAGELAHIVNGPVTVEFGDAFVTVLVSPVSPGSTDGLGALLMLPDGTVLIEAFDEIDAAVAVAHFDVAMDGGSVRIALIRDGSVA